MSSQAKQSKKTPLTNPQGNQAFSISNSTLINNTNNYNNLYTNKPNSSSNQQTQVNPMFFNLAKYFNTVADYESQIDQIRVSLNKLPDFSQSSLFNILDTDSKGFISHKDLVGLLENIDYNDASLRMFIHSFDKNDDYCLDFLEFCNLIGSEVQEQQESKQVTNEMLSKLRSLVLAEIELIDVGAEIIDSIKQAVDFTTYSCFIAVTCNKGIVIDEEMLSRFCEANGFGIKSMRKVIWRLSSKGEESLSLNEFTNIFTPFARRKRDEGDGERDGEMIEGRDIDGEGRNDVNERNDGNFDVDEVIIPNDDDEDNLDGERERDRGGFDSGYDGGYDVDNVIERDNQGSNYQTSQGNINNINNNNNNDYSNNYNQNYQPYQGYKAKNNSNINDTKTVKENSNKYSQQQIQNQNQNQPQPFTHFRYGSNNSAESELDKAYQNREPVIKDKNAVKEAKKIEPKEGDLLKQTYQTLNKPYEKYQVPSKENYQCANSSSNFNKTNEFNNTLKQSGFGKSNISTYNDYREKFNDNRELTKVTETYTPYKKSNFSSILRSQYPYYDYKSQVDYSQLSPRKIEKDNIPNIRTYRDYKLENTNLNSYSVRDNDREKDRNKYYFTSGNFNNYRISSPPRYRSQLSNIDSPKQSRFDLISPYSYTMLSPLRYLSRLTSPFRYSQYYTRKLESILTPSIFQTTVNSPLRTNLTSSPQRISSPNRLNSSFNPKSTITSLASSNLAYYLARVLDQENSLNRTKQLIDLSSNCSIREMYSLFDVHGGGVSLVDLKKTVHQVLELNVDLEELNLLIKRHDSNNDGRLK